MHSDSSVNLQNIAGHVGHVRERAEIESPAEIRRSAVTSSPRMHRAVQDNTGHDIPLNAPLQLATARTIGSPVRARDIGLNENCLSKKKPRCSGLTSPPPIPPRSVCRVVPRVPCSRSAELTQPKQAAPNIPRIRSLNTLPTAAPRMRDESTSKKNSHKSYDKRTVKSSKSTPGLATIAKGQDENVMNSAVVPRIDILEAKLPSSASCEWKAQVVGSQQMVDFFLQSRRKAIQGSRTVSENTSIAAFL